MYKALYRTERPEVFSQVLGQDHILRVLRHQIDTDTVGHAYLFCGTRGTGKTTMARLLAKAANCTGDGERPCGECDNCRAIQAGTFPDMIEIDAASNNGVDNVREIRESVNYPPAVGRRKVYIIDEAHMLSKPALNALLKTLEEPPENVMFILATTDPQQLLQTIRSRCMRFDFRRIPESEIAGRMKEICEARGIKATDDALSLLAVNADGSVRDGLSLLDQCISGSSDTLTREMVLDCLGTVSDEFFIRLTDCVSEGDVGGALVLLDEALADGRDVKQMLSDWLAHYRALLIGKYVKDPGDMLNMSLENISRVREQSGSLSLDEIRRGIMTIAKAISDARYSTQPRTLMELAVVTLASETAPAEDRHPRKSPAPKQNIKTKAKSELAKAVIRSGSSGTAPEQTAAPEQEVEEREPAPKSGAPVDHAPADCESAQAESAPLDFEPAPAESASLEFEPAPAGCGPAPAVEPEDSAEDPADSDYEEIWGNACEIFCVDLTDTMIKNGSRLAAMNDSEFKVLTETDLVRDMIERKRAQIQKAMGQVTGKDLKMVVKTAGSGTGGLYAQTDDEESDSGLPGTDESGDADRAGSEGAASGGKPARTRKPSKEDYEKLADTFSDEFGFKPKVR